MESSLCTAQQKIIKVKFSETSVILSNMVQILSTEEAWISEAKQGI